MQLSCHREFYSFSESFSFVHLVNNDKRVERGQPDHDGLFNVCFLAVYGPFKGRLLDERTIAFKGRSTLKVAVNHFLLWTDWRFSQF